MGIFETLLYAPAYNLLIAIYTGIAGGVVGIVIVILPFILSIILFPLIYASTKTQSRQQVIQPKLQELMEKYKTDPKKRMEKILTLYKENGIRPGLSFLLLIIQIVVVIIFSIIIIREELFTIREDLIYSFLSLPPDVTTVFLGFDLEARSILLALVAGVSQFLLINTILKNTPTSTVKKKETEELQRMVRNGMRIIMPLLIGVYALFFSAGVALYWSVTALVAFLREIFILGPLKRKLFKENDISPTTTNHTY